MIEFRIFEVPSGEFVLAGTADRSVEDFLRAIGDRHGTAPTMLRPSGAGACVTGTVLTSDGHGVQARLSGQAYW